jgi:CRP-like cAMP-binding protein
MNLEPKLNIYLYFMFEVLHAYFEKNFPLSDENKDLIASVFLTKTLKKGEFLVREGEIAKYGAFVCKGFLRSYVIDNKGKEHIIQFAPENWWISDKAGLTTGAASTFFIDAVEDSELLLTDLAGHLTLVEKLPGYGLSFQTGMQKRSAARDHRIVASLSATAEERYKDFLETYPNIAQRVPQHMLASYLGITPETVSRIRKQASRRK